MENLKKKISTVVLMVCVLSSTGLLAASQHINETENTNLSQNASWQMNPAIWEDLVVWEDYRDDPLGSWATPGNRNSNIYLMNISSGETVRLSQNDSSQVNPDIWENYVVWEDHRNGDPDIYMIDLDDPEDEIRITDDQGSQKRPKIHGGKIVWEDYRENDFGDIYMYDIATGTESPVSTERAIQNSPYIHGDRVVWTDYRNFWAGEYTQMRADIFVYDISTEEEFAVAEGDVNQNRPSIYKDTVVWTEYSEGTNNIYMRIIGEEKQIISAESTSEQSPRIYAGRVVFFEVDRISQYSDSIYVYNILENSKELIAKVDIPEGESPGPTYARNPVIHQNKIVWEERHPSEHPNLSNQYDIYHTTVENEAPDILWSKIETHTGEEGIEVNVTLEEGAYVTVSSEVIDVDSDLDSVYVTSDEMDIDELEMERYNDRYFSVDIPIENKGVFQLTVSAVDRAGNLAYTDNLFLYVQTPLPEIKFAGVGTSMEDLSNEVEFILEEGNTLHFAAEVDEWVESARLVIEEYLPDGANMEQKNDTYVLSVPYQETMTLGNKTAYIEVADEDGRTVQSDELIIRAVEPERVEEPTTGILYMVLLIFAILLALVLVIRKFKPELLKRK